MVAGNSTYGPLAALGHYRRDGLGDAGFSALPSTTPFNLEAIAVDAWPYAARSREVFSGDDQFFEGVLSRTLELNRADNPFSALTVVRALVLAAELGFRIGPNSSSTLPRRVWPLVPMNLSNCSSSTTGT